MFSRITTALLLITMMAFGLGASLFAGDDFRDGIRSQSDWYKRFDETHDYRIFYLLANRAGKRCDTDQAKVVSEQIKATPSKRQKVFENWGIDVDPEAFNDNAFKRWQDTYGDQNPNEVVTRHYRVFYTKKDQKFAKVLAYYMDSIYKFYEKKFKMDEDIEGRFIVKLHPSKDAYIQAGGSPNSFAYFSGAQRSLVGSCEDFDKPEDEVDYAIRLIQTFFHEGFHQFLGYYVPNPPSWLNEGMAENFEAIVFRKRKLYENRNINNNNLLWLKQFLRQRQTTPLKELIYMTQAEMYESANIHYPQSWGVIHFLAHGSRQNRKYYQDLIKELKNGADRTEAIDRVFGNMDWDKFEDAFRSYIFDLNTTKIESQL